jgi:hypothetical protein
MKPGINLPACADLPDVPALTSAQVRAALGGVSRAVACQWRRNHGLPRAVRVGNDTLTSTDSVAAWLRARGVLVRMVPQPPPASPAEAPQDAAR